MIIHCEGICTQISLSITDVFVFAWESFSIDVNWCFAMSEFFGHKLLKVQYIGYYLITVPNIGNSFIILR